jgi:cobalt-precorrin 5A hydrolase
MADRKAMAGLIAIGVGCRKGCTGAAIVAVVRRALATAGEPPGKREMFTLDEKASEANVREAASTLGLPLYFVPHERLLREASRVVTPSARVERLVGVPGVAETAALAGAGPNGELIVAKIVGGGATCAIALRREAPE